MVAAAFRASEWLRHGGHVPLDVHSFEFVSAVVADEVCHSSKHIAFGLWFMGAKDDANECNEVCFNCRA